MGEKSTDAGAELLVTKPLKKTSFQSKKRGPSWTLVTESPVSNRMSVPPTRPSEVLSLSHPHPHVSLGHAHMAKTCFGMFFLMLQQGLSLWVRLLLILEIPPFFFSLIFPFFEII